MENKRKTSNPAPPSGGLQGAEVWKPISDFPRYEVSNMGRVRSSWCKNGRKEQFILKPRTRYNGYFCIDLYDSDPITGRVKVKTVSIHRLVARAFIGLCPEGYVIDHINGDNWDNRVENLRYVTPSENRRSTHIERFKNGFRIEVFHDGVFIEEVTSRKRLIDLTLFPLHSSLNQMFGNNRIWRYKNFVAILHLPIDSPPALPGGRE